MKRNNPLKELVHKWLHYSNSQCNKFLDNHWYNKYFFFLLRENTSFWTSIVLFFLLKIDVSAKTGPWFWDQIWDFFLVRKSAPDVQKSGPDFVLKEKNKKRIFQREFCFKFWGFYVSINLDPVSDEKRERVENKA